MRANIQPSIDGMSTQASAPTAAIPLEHWVNALTPLNETERISINGLSEWVASLHRPQASSITAGRGQHGAGIAAVDAVAATAVQDDAGKLDDHVPIASTSQQNGPGLPVAPLSDAPAFLAWYAQQQAAIATHAQSDHAAALQQIEQAADEADALLDHLEAARGYIAELRAGAQMVEEGTEGLREDAESMVERIDHLSHVADALSVRLSYFAILPSATSFLSSPSLALVTTQEFMLTMERLDVALAFLAAHPHYRDAPLYRMRFEHCLVRAGTLIRMFVVGRWRDLTREVMEQLREWERTRTEVSAKGKEKESQAERSAMMYLAEPRIAALLYDRVEGEASTLQPLLHELEKRAAATATPMDAKVGPGMHNGKQRQSIDGTNGDQQEDTLDAIEVYHAPEFAALLEECRTAYLDGRRSLLSGIVASCVARIEVMARHPSAEDEMANTNGEGGAEPASTATMRLVQRGMAFVTAVHAAETELYGKFYTHRSGEETADVAIDPSTRALHAYLRSLSAPLDERIGPGLDGDGTATAAGLSALSTSTLRSLETWREYLIGFLG